MPRENRFDDSIKVVESMPQRKAITMSKAVGEISTGTELTNKEIAETFVAYGNGVVDLIPAQRANAGTCKICGKNTSKVERHLCVDCFKKNASMLYERLIKAVM
jgi:hypothetical protein